MSVRLPSPSAADETGLAAVNRFLRDRAHRDVVTWLGEPFTEGLVRGDSIPRTVALPIAPASGDILAAFAEVESQRVRLVGPHSAGRIVGAAEMGAALADGWVASADDATAPAVLEPLVAALGAALLGPVRVVLSWAEGTGLGTAPGWAGFERLFVVVGAAHNFSLSAWDRSDQSIGTVAVAPGSVLRVPPGLVPACTSLDARGGLVELDLRPLPADTSDGEEAAVRAALPPPSGGAVLDDGPGGRRLAVGSHVLGTLESLGPTGVRRRLEEVLPYGALAAMDGRDDGEESG